MTSLTHNDYTIAWICALPLEVAAARVMLSKVHNSLPNPSSDPNAYELGEVNGHYIVIVCLPSGIYGKVSAATVVSRMRSTFPRLQYGLLVGIGGGVPSKTNDIRLGDVVVSKPVGRYSGVIQYDYGKTVQGGQFELTGALNKPPLALLTRIGQLEAKQMTDGDNPLDEAVRKTLEEKPNMKAKFSPPEPEMDLLFQPSYHHVANGDTCDKCDRDKLVKRQPRNTRRPRIHYGLIASGDQVMKDSETRDLLAQQHGILCFEMEAAGLMDGLPSLVIRGICDYCDSHKQKGWQGYAALVAAAYAKLLLSVVPVSSPTLHLTESNRKRHWMVPLARNPRFVGREAEITELERLIRMRDGPRRVAVTGLGGVGKTQVALELAYRVRDRYTHYSVFWIPCTSHEMIEQTYLCLAQKLGLHVIEHTDVKTRVKEHLESQYPGKWLLIFDNADDMDMWLPASGGLAAGLEAVLPQSEQGRIVFTSRNRKLAVDLTFSNIIPIPDEDREIALQILKRSLVEETPLEDHVTTNALLEQLCFLPLAIAQASAYINKNGLSLSTYLDLLKQQESEVVILLSEDFQDAGRYMEIQNPVIATWLISFKEIQRLNPLSADYLSFMSCLNPRNIPLFLLPLPSSQKHQADALGLLKVYSFIDFQDGNINMHRLVHISTRNWLKQNARLDYWIQEAANHVQNILPSYDIKKWKEWSQYLPHVLKLLHEEEIMIRQEQFADLIERVSLYLYSDLRSREPEALYTDLFKICHEKYGPEHPLTLINKHRLSIIHVLEKRLDDAENIILQATETMTRVLGPTHRATMESIDMLVPLYHKSGRWNEAEGLIIDLIETRKAVQGPEDSETLGSMIRLVETYHGQGRLIEAEKLNTQILDTSKTVLGWEHVVTQHAIRSLVSIYQDQGRHGAAEKLQMQILEKLKGILGIEHLCTRYTMMLLAVTYREQKRYKEAEKLWLELFEIQKIVLGTEHPETLIAMTALAFTLRDQGKLWDAIPLMEECSDLHKRVSGPSHPDTIFTSQVLSEWINMYYNLTGAQLTLLQLTPIIRDGWSRLKRSTFLKRRRFHETFN